MPPRFISRLLSLGVLLVAGGACTPEGLPQKAELNGQKGQWFRSVSEGKLIQRLNQAVSDGPGVKGFIPKEQQALTPSGNGLITLLENPPRPAACQSVGTALTAVDARRSFGRCLQELFRGPLLLRDALAATRLFQEPAPSQWIEAYAAGGADAVASLSASINVDAAFSLDQRAVRSQVSSKLRRSYSAVDLMSEDRLLRLFEAESRSAAREVRAFLNELPEKSIEQLGSLDRYDWLIGLARDELEAREAPAARLVDPFGYLAAVPSAGDENSSFSSSDEVEDLLEELVRTGVGENPRDRLERWSLYLRVLEGDQEMERRWLMSSEEGIGSSSENDRPIQVAFIDTGIDLVNYPELAMVVHPLRNLTDIPASGFEFGSYDFADENRSPYMVANGDLAHGTGTAATFLTQLARLDPGSVAMSRYSLQSWKVASIRSMLAGGGDPGFTAYDPLHLNSFQRAVIEPLHALSVRGVPGDPAVQDVSGIPSIVSISAAFPLYSAMRAAGESTLLKRAPWLWVMAAGNDRRELGKTGAGAGTACFGEFPANLRPSENILCVGAVVRGIFDDTLSSRTNTGVRVDLYTYEDVSNLCPEGTSCAAPSITAAAALLFQKFPGISAETVRESLMAASEEKWVKREQRQLRLATQPAPESGEAMVAIRFFDPSTMMDAAYEEAASRYEGVGRDRDSVSDPSLRAAQPEAVSR